MIFNTLSDKIWSIDNFLSKGESDNLIIFSEMRGYSEAEISLSDGPKMMKGIRNNERLIFTDFKLAEDFWNKVSPYCPKIIDDMESIGLNESFRFYRYDVNQRFKMHIDGRFKKSETEESRITFMIYLNDDFKGGETRFNDLTVHPNTGKALLFIHEQKEESIRDKDGMKYVLRTDLMFRNSKTN